MRDLGCHLASSSGSSLGDLHEFHVLRRPSTGELRVPTPGVWMRDCRRVSDEQEDLSTGEVLMLVLGSASGSADSSGISRTCCRAAMSSGDAFFLTCCRSLIASAISTFEPEAKDNLESDMPASLAAEPCLLPKHDRELERELDREFDLEFDLEAADRDASRVLVVSTALSFFCTRGCWSNSSARSDRSVSLICCRPSALTSTGDGDSDESPLEAGATELVLVFGLDSLLALGVLGWLPMLLGCSECGESGGAHRDKTRCIGRKQELGLRVQCGAGVLWER